jgi:hypothetical protein
MKLEIVIFQWFHFTDCEQYNLDVVEVELDAKFRIEWNKQTLLIDLIPKLATTSAV